MALSSTQLVTVAEIVRRSLDDVETAAGFLTAEQETAIATDITLWNTIRNSHVRLDGEVDFDNERKRQAIRDRVSLQLDLPLYEVPTFFTVAPGTRGF